MVNLLNVGRINYQTTCKKERTGMYPKNYRLVSNLSFISKLVERACLDQFMSCIESSELLPSYQSAYHKGFSIETVLVKLSNDMENQSVTALVCIDLLAAFDTVHHGILLDVLQQKMGLMKQR